MVTWYGCTNHELDCSTVIRKKIVFINQGGRKEQNVPLCEVKFDSRVGNEDQKGVCDQNEGVTGIGKIGHLQQCHVGNKGKDWDPVDCGHEVLQWARDGYHDELPFKAHLKRPKITKKLNIKKNYGQWQRANIRNWLCQFWSVSAFCIKMTQTYFGF